VGQDSCRCPHALLDRAQVLQLTLLQVLIVLVVVLVVRFGALELLHSRINLSLDRFRLEATHVEAGGERLVVVVVCLFLLIRVVGSSAGGPLGGLA
jgi:hypothetical protein